MDQIKLLLLLLFLLLWELSVIGQFAKRRFSTRVNGWSACGVRLSMATFR